MRLLVRQHGLARFSLVKILHVEVLTLLRVPSLVVAELVPTKQVAVDCVAGSAFCMVGFPAIGGFLTGVLLPFIKPLGVLVQISVHSLLSSLGVARAHGLLLPVGTAVLELL